MRRRVVPTSMLMGAALAVAMGAGGCGGGAKYVMASSSMSPTIRRGEIVIAKPFHPNCDKIQKYDIIVFQSPVGAQAPWIMRVVAVPGESVAVSTNSLVINGAEVPANA